MPNAASRPSPQPSPRRGEGDRVPEGLEVCRRSDLEAHLRTRARVPKAKAPGMEHRPIRLARPAAAVLGVARERVTERSQMHADLMGASRVEVTAQECMRAAFFDDLVSRARKPPAGHHRHTLAILRMAADCAFELACIRLE